MRNKTNLKLAAGILGVVLLAVQAIGAREVMVAPVHGIIGPVTASFIEKTIDQAEAQNVACVIFELDTPGGLYDSMLTIVKRIMAAKVPVVVYVAPSGSRATSAGAFITVAAHVAAMAPGTTIGAAHPVSIGPNSAMDTNLAMTAKAENDAAAYIRAIAEKRGRNIEWAEAAVRKSVSLSETEALEKKAVDLVAPSTAALLEALDGRAVMVGTNEVKLATKGAALVGKNMNWRDELLATLANPNLAYILLMLGLLGLYFEFSNPGAILPGVVGAISLILAFYAFQTLSVNLAGILLILLAVVLFIVDIKAATHGVLTTGGVVAMFIGSIMLFDSPDPALRASLQVIIPVVAVIAIFFIIGVILSVAALTRKPVSGQPGLVGLEGDARTAITAKDGRVFVAGTHWNALSDAPIAEGARVKVVQVKGMTLKVEAI
jgi:membrane-bound serine protease (ClpP class)